MGVGCPALPTLHRSVSIYLFGCLSVRQYICLSVCLSVWLPVYQAVYLFVCLPVCQAVYLLGCLSIRHYICLLICLSICLFRSLSFCVSIYLSGHVSACRCSLPHWYTICWTTSFYHLLTIPLIFCNACNCLLFFSFSPLFSIPPYPLFVQLRFSSHSFSFHFLPFLHILLLIFSSPFPFLNSFSSLHSSSSFSYSFSYSFPTSFYFPLPSFQFENQALLSSNALWMRIYSSERISSLFTIGQALTLLP